MPAGRFDWLGAVVAVLAIGGLAFGAIRGQDRQWQDPLAWAALGVGIVGARSRSRSSWPGAPTRSSRSDLFRPRQFSIINLSTLLIYGALYTTFTFEYLFLQGVLGYSATAAGIVGAAEQHPADGAVDAGRLARRPDRGTAVPVDRPAADGRGPGLVRARAGDLRTRGGSAPSDPATFLPPVAVFVDVLPAMLLFGVGISLVVAPLDLDPDVVGPGPQRGPRVGDQQRDEPGRAADPARPSSSWWSPARSTPRSREPCPGSIPTAPTLRAQVQPLNPPKAGTPQEVADAARDASTEAFHLAALVCAGLLAAGAAANWVGLREEAPARAGQPDTSSPPSA